MGTVQRMTEESEKGALICLRFYLMSTLEKGITSSLFSIGVYDPVTVPKRETFLGSWGRKFSHAYAII